MRCPAAVLIVVFLFCYPSNCANICNPTQYSPLTRFKAANLTRHDFVRLIEEDGKSFILEGLFDAGWVPGLSKWKCRHLGESAQFGEVEVRREYASDLTAGGSMQWVKLKDLLTATEQGRASKE